MDLYLKYVDSGSTDETSKQKIIIYNEDDCFATMHIYDWVMAQEAQLYNGKSTIITKQTALRSLE